MWIHIYSLPQEYWHEEILMGIGNTLGFFVKIVDTNQQGCYTSYLQGHYGVNMTFSSSIELDPNARL